MNQQPGSMPGGQPSEPKQGVATWLWVSLVVVIVAAAAVWYFYIR